MGLDTIAAVVDEALDDALPTILGYVQADVQHNLKWVTASARVLPKHVDHEYSHFHKRYDLRSGRILDWRKPCLLSIDLLVQPMGVYAFGEGVRSQSVEQRLRAELQCMSSIAPTTQQLIKESVDAACLQIATTCKIVYKNND